MASDKPLPEHLKKSLEGSKAEYVRLGNSGLRVSVPIFGAMSIGDKRTLPWCIEEEKVPIYFAFSDSTHLFYDKNSKLINI